MPSTLELADEFTLRAVKNRTGNKRFSGCRGHLIVELDGQKKSVCAELQELKKLLGKLKLRFLDQALGGIAVESIW